MPSCPSGSERYLESREPPRLSGRDPSSWTVEDVMQFIREADPQLGSHADLFRKHVGISVSVFLVCCSLWILEGMAICSVSTEHNVSDAILSRPQWALCLPHSYHRLSLAAFPLGLWPGAQFQVTGVYLSFSQGCFTPVCLSVRLRDFSPS